MRKRHLSALALLLVMVLVGSILAGCSPKQSAAPAGGDQQTPTEQKIVTYSVTDEVPTLDPQLINSIPSSNIAIDIMEGLIRVQDGKVQPGMAEKWEISPDGKTYTFHLRDAKWNDGTPVTAGDFEYGMKRLLDPKLASPYAFAGYTILNGYEYNTGKLTDVSQVGVKAIDDKTLEIKLVNPTAYFLSYLYMSCFLPTKQENVDKFGSAFGTDADKICYNGPFILKEWKHEEGLTLEKNPDYWNKDSIKLDSIKVLQIKDSNTALSMFENGELDFCDIPSAMVEQYMKDGKALVYMSGADDWIRINMSRKDKPWYGNKNFRLALNYALDREDYVKVATKNLYFPATRLVLPIVHGVSGYYCDEYPVKVYDKKADLTKAKEYLDKAMKELNITDPKKIEVEFTTADTEESKLIAEALQDQYTRNLGITFKIKLVTYKEKLDDDVKGNYETIYAGWGPDYDDPMTYMELFESMNSQNSGKYNNPEYDKLIEYCRTETDPAKRCEAFAKAEQMLMEDAVIVPLQYRQRAWACNPKLKGVVRNFVGADTDVVHAYWEE